MEFSGINARVMVMDRINKYADERNITIPLMTRMYPRAKDEEEKQFFTDFFKSGPSFFIDFIKECCKVLKVKEEDISFDVYCGLDQMVVNFYWHDGVFINKNHLIFSSFGCVNIEETKIKTPTDPMKEAKLLKKFVGTFTMASFK